MTEPVANSEDVLEHLPAERVEKLRDLLDEVLRVNRQFNLTAIREPEEAWNKHIVDSLQGLRTNMFSGTIKVADIGAGAGFPGLALAVACPELRLTAVEATRKKCDFIQAASSKLGLAVNVLCERAEVAGQDRKWRENFDVAVARAVGAFGEVCELALPFVRVGGHLVLWRGQAGPDEVHSAKSALDKLGGEHASTTVLSYTIPGHEMKYHLIVIRKKQPTPAGYPRRIGLPKQRPL